MSQLKPLEMVKQLNETLLESHLVEILRRNLLPEIQHEILNLDMYSVTHLIDIFRKMEIPYDLYRQCIHLRNMIEAYANCKAFSYANRNEISKCGPNK